MKKNLFLTLLLSIAPAFVVSSAWAGGEDYYRQFMYATEEMDDGDGEITYQYRSLMSFFNEIPIAPNRRLSVHVNLYLLPNDEYVMTYSESFMVRARETDPWGMEMTETTMCPRVIRGTWRAPNQMLETDQGFHADRTVFDSRPAVKLVLDRAIQSSEAVGKDFVMDYGYSMMPMEMDLNRPFCR